MSRIVVGLTTCRQGAAETSLAPPLRRCRIETLQVGQGLAWGERLYGWSAAEALGHISDELLATRFPEPLDSIESRLETTGSWQGELVHTARDGSHIVVSSR